MLIDKQLFGLYNIFGNGVISGWQVTAEETTNSSGISVAISPGIGIINFIAGETTFPQTIDNLPANSVFDIFAVLSGSAVQDRRVAFTLSATDISSNEAIRIARVVTNSANIQSINNSDFRQLISFREIIKEEIDKHKHRGTPTKIDLQDETKNQLPGAKLEGIDADKIKSGIFDIDRIPLVDHNDLEHSGLLTHEALDSFVKTLSENNKELLGEISTVNVIKQVIFLKYQFSDVDEHFINALNLIPGISPNKFIDFESSTANISLIEKCISGLPPSTGEFVSIVWDDDTSFLNAIKRTNVEIANDQVTLIRDQNAEDIIENFENVDGSGSALPGFDKETEVIIDNLSCIAEGGDSLRMEGFFSGKFVPERTFQAVYTKTFDIPKDWTLFDQLVLNVKSVSNDHKPVFAYFINGTETETQSINFLILQEDERTEDPDPAQNNFVRKTFDISDEARDQVTKFVIFTADTEGGFVFYLDKIFVRNNNLFAPQGSIKFRFSSETPITFHSIFYTVDQPVNTQVRVRIKTAATRTLLNRAAFTAPLNSGNIFATDGTSSEIEVILITDDQTVTPILSRLELRLLVDANFNGFEIQDSTDWALGDLQNIDIESNSVLGGSSILIDDPINVGGLYYANKDAISEINDLNVGVFGFSGNNLPISPRQALNFFESKKRGFDRATSVVRRQNHNFIVADNRNDRVFEFDSQGNIIRGFGAVHVGDDSFYPFSSLYNPTNGILTIVFSKNIDKDSVDLERISIFIGATELVLGTGDTIVDSKKTANILDIQLSSTKVNQLIGITSNLTVDFKSGAFAEEIAINTKSQALFGTLGIECFVANFKYTESVKRPVYADILTNGNWIIANSQIEFNPGEEADIGNDTQLAADPSGILVVADQTGSTTITGGVPPYTIQTEPNPAFATALFSGTVLNISGVTIGATEVVVRDSSESPLTIKIPITTQSTGQASPADVATVISVPSLVEFDFDSELVIFSYNDVTFSDYSLGSIKERNEESFIIAGLFASESAINSGDTIESSFENPTPKQQFLVDGANVLAPFRGVVIILNKETGSILFEYSSPDGLYPSSVDIKSDGNFAIAESSFIDASGRIILLDTFGNIIFQNGSRFYNVINDVTVRTNDNLVISV